MNIQFCRLWIKVLVKLSFQLCLSRNRISVSGVMFRMLHNFKTQKY